MHSQSLQPSLSQQPSIQRPQRKASVQFGAGSLMTPINRFVGWAVPALYDHGEGRRYLVEQTLGYTAPRTWQQFNRTRHITQEGNKMAAMEMLIRDLAADFADTILPGFLATFSHAKTRWFSPTSIWMP
jgi:hypothetical protein